MIVVTGAAGFIGSCLVQKLNNLGFKDLILVDDFSHADKKKNLEDKKYFVQIERTSFFEWLSKKKIRRLNSFFISEQEQIQRNLINPFLTN